MSLSEPSPTATDQQPPDPDLEVFFEHLRLDNPFAANRIVSPALGKDDCEEIHPAKKKHFANRWQCSSKARRRHSARHGHQKVSMVYLLIKGFVNQIP